jgi:hypothetical protein
VVEEFEKFIELYREAFGFASWDIVIKEGKTDEGVLAETQSEPHRRWMRITINPDEEWEDVNVETVAVHELVHALVEQAGTNETTFKVANLYAQYSDNDTKETWQWLLHSRWEALVDNFASTVVSIRKHG